MHTLREIGTTLLKQIDIRFSTWLMSRVDELAQTLLIGDGNCIHFNKYDVGRVFGIRSAGWSIFFKSVCRRMLKLQHSRNLPQTPKNYVVLR